MALHGHKEGKASAKIVGKALPKIKVEKKNVKR